MSLIRYNYQLIDKLGYASDATTDEKLAVLFTLLETKPDFAHEIHYWIGTKYSANDRYEEARAAYLKAVELSDDRQFLALVYGALAFLAIRQEEEDYDQYLDYLLKSLEYEPEDENNLYMVGEEYLERGEHDLAATYLLQLHAINPKNPHANRYLGRLYEETAQHDLAMQYYTQALPLVSTGDPDIYQGLARLYFEKKEMDRTREMLLEANKHYPSAYNHYGLALTYQEEKDQYRALHHFHEALKLDPNYFDVYNNLAKLYYELEGDFKKAQEHLEKAAELATDTKQRQLVYLNLARLYKEVADDDNNEKYKAKFMEELGFSVGFEDGEEGWE